MSTLSRLGLPTLALTLVVGVVGVQLAHGGGTFEPLAAADPCLERAVTSRADGIDGLTERLVLLGVDGAACRLGLSREALTLDLARPGARTDAEVEALRQGLQAGVRRLADDGSLPSTSALLDEALAQADLNRFLELAVRAVPDGVVDAALPLDDLLERAVDDLDLRGLLGDLDDEAALEQQVEAALTRAVQDALTDRVRDLV